MHALPLHLEPGSDVRLSLEQLARARGAHGFVLSVVGNLSQAAFQCPGQAEPTLLHGELEIITLQGTLSAQGVHLHLSVSDSQCQVWGGHLEPGTLVLKGADLLVGSFSAASNVTGILTDTDAVTRILRAHGAVAIWDYGAAAPYVPMSMQAGTDAAKDAIVFSPHKFPGGPGASGVLVVRDGSIAYAGPADGAPANNTPSAVADAAPSFHSALPARHNARHSPRARDSSN